LGGEVAAHADARIVPAAGFGLRGESPLFRFRFCRSLTVLSASLSRGLPAGAASEASVQRRLPRRPRGLIEPGAFALRAGRECDGALHERPDVRLQCVDVLGQEHLLDSRNEALIGEVQFLDLHLGRFLVEEVVELFLGVLRNVEGEGGGRPDVRLAEHTTRSIALASVTVPTVERALAPIRS